MPAVLDVDPVTYDDVGTALLSANDAVCDVVAAAATAAGAGGGMAGTDSGGVEWSASYDAAAAAALSAGATLADSLGHLGALLSLSGANHADADTASTPGGPPSYPGSGWVPAPVGVVPATPPSANGTGDDPPAGWFLVAHLLQLAWPNGHQDRLRAVASGWDDGATRLTEIADRLTGPIGDLSAVQSPEIDAAVSTCTDVQLSARSLSDAYASLGRACSDYATHLDEAHTGVVAVLVDFAVESAGLQVLSALAAPVTAGLSEAAGQAAQAARTALAASRISRILTKLLDVVRTVTAAVRAVGTRIADVLTKLRAVLAKGGAKAVETAAPRLARTATCDVRKFSEYVLSPTKNRGKLVVYQKYGYSEADAEKLASIYSEQAAAKFEAGDYQLGKVDGYGQRVTIDIEIPGQGAATGTTAVIKSGWIINADGTIRMTTPFAG